MVVDGWLDRVFEPCRRFVFRILRVSRLETLLLIQKMHKSLCFNKLDLGGGEAIDNQFENSSADPALTPLFLCIEVLTAIESAT
jgi:hypothetical protein